MLTTDKVIGIFCFIDDLLQAGAHYEDTRRRVSDSEVITTAVVSSLYFGGHQDKGRQFMKMTVMIPFMLDKSRFNRLLYGFVLQPYNLVDPALTKLNGQGTLWLCKLVFAGHNLQLVQGTNQIGMGELIKLDGHPTIAIFSGCNGLELFVLFAGFVCCMPLRAGRMAILALGGILLIYVLNILRCTALVALRYHQFSLFNVAHHYISQYTVYLVIFLVWERFFKLTKLGDEAAAQA